MASGDFGVSLSKPGQPVAKLLKDRALNSLLLALCINIVSFILGVGIGIVTSLKQRTLIDDITRIISLFGYSMPSFWLAIILIYIFSVHLGVLPSSGLYSIAATNSTLLAQIIDVAKHLVLPTLTVGIIGAAFTARLTRSSMLEVVNNDYIRTARAKGLKESALVFKHMLRNAMKPIVTITGLQIGYLFGSMAVTESVFAWPGIGREVILATTYRDYPVIMAITLLVGVLFAFINLVVDVLYVIIDPRIKY